jgi:adenylate cyclase
MTPDDVPRVDDGPPGDGASPGEAERRAQWEALLTGTDQTLRQMRRMFGRIPRGPRCKVCASPFQGPGGLLMRLMNHGRSAENVLMCGACFGSLQKNIGGAEIEISVLFADVRGSTGLAERTTAERFGHLLRGFYGVAARAIESHDGIVDKFLGDGVMALFIPVLTGENHRGRAIDAGLDLLDMAERRELVDGGVRVGAGIHSGVAYVGVMGPEGRHDFTALGDTVNAAARLGSAAGPGELLLSRGTWDSTGRPLDGASTRLVEIAGRSEALDVVIARPVTAIAAA